MWMHDISFLSVTGFSLGSLNLRDRFFLGSGYVHEFVWYKYDCGLLFFLNHDPLKNQMVPLCN